MTTIIYIPLDERPVNRIFPQTGERRLESSCAHPRQSYWDQKRPANLGALWEWLEKNCGADKLLCSLDMLFTRHRTSDPSAV